MAEYQKIEYCIGLDGRIHETVIGATGAGCTQSTAGIEQAIGKVEQQKLKPEYYEGEGDTITTAVQSSIQQL